MKTKPFENKVAIVTGSSMGIGRTTAELLARKGAIVILNGRDKEKLFATEQELLNAGFEVFAIAADVRYAEQCQELIRDVVRNYGRIDILINNAGISSRGSVEDMAPKNFKVLMDANFSGSAYMSKYGISHLRKTKGSLVFINSVGGYRGMPYNSAYTASKIAQAALADALRVELFDSEIHVGLIHVSYTENDPRKKILDVDGSWTTLPKRTNVKLTTRDTVAESICRMIEDRTEEITLTPLGVLTALMTRFFPRLSTWLLRINRERIYREFTLIDDQPAVEGFASNVSEMIPAEVPKPPNKN